MIMPAVSSRSRHKPTRADGYDREEKHLSRRDERHAYKPLEEGARRLEESGRSSRTVKASKELRSHNDHIRPTLRHKSTRTRVSFSNVVQYFGELDNKASADDEGIEAGSSEENERSDHFREKNGSLWRRGCNSQGEARKSNVTRNSDYHDMIEETRGTDDDRIEEPRMEEPRTEKPHTEQPHIEEHHGEECKHFVWKRLEDDEDAIAESRGSSGDEDIIWEEHEDDRFGYQYQEDRIQADEIDDDRIQEDEDSDEEKSHEEHSDREKSDEENSYDESADDETEENDESDDESSYAIK
ncbi:hypothetical protein BU16DRAFT_600778 [Lophium mytilinum]|uniref:Uncharacterized protein n=1 Tax=Lophium mytilinum TaxID=390894 RepID=A0A6A6Q9A8_9PEZI|nr:hypothetical protein BU16DRAFT_600778 [Lophium mytilinum]